MKGAAVSYQHSSPDLERALDIARERVRFNAMHTQMRGTLDQSDTMAHALVSLFEQFDALKLAATRQLTPLDVASTHIDILRRNSESYDARGRDNVALIVENAVNEARKALFDAISNPANRHISERWGPSR